MAVQNNFSSHWCVLPSGAKRRKARPGAAGAPVEGGGAAYNGQGWGWRPKGS